MLEYLRNAADKPFAKFLMFILIFSFVGWGAADWILGGGRRETTLVSVGNADVSMQQFNNERSRQLSMMSREEQRATYTDPKKSAMLNNAVMSKLTMDQLALNRAKDLGFFVSDKRIADEIKSYPQFQSNGQYVPWMFEAFLRNTGMSEQDVANSLRSDILRNMTLGATNVPVAVPQFAVDAVFNARYAKRGIHYTVLKFADYKVANPDEEQLRNFYASHPINVPETRSVSYVFVPADTSKPDAYDAGHALGEKIEDMIFAGDSMKDAANKYGAKYAVVKNVVRGAKSSDKILNEDLVEKIFSMDSGKESEMLDLKDGFIILRVDEVVAEHDAKFDDVKKSIVNDWKKSEQRKNAYIAANEKLSALKNGETIKHTKNTNVTRTEGAPLAVLNAAFAGKIGDSVIAEDGDAFYVVRINENILPKSDATKKEALRKELEKMYVRFVQDDYTRFLKQTYPVKINEEAFDKTMVR